MKKITLILCSLVFATLAHAFDSKVMDEKLKTFDPAAVAAAKEYARIFDMKGQMQKTAPLIAQNLTAALKDKNPTMNEAQQKKFFEVFFKVALVDSAPLVEQMTIVIMLDVFNREELEANVKFYGSPVGQSILKKFPLMMARIPEIQQNLMQSVIPDAIKQATDALKKDGFELKL